MKHLTSFALLLLAAIPTLVIAAEPASQIKIGGTVQISRDGVKLMVGSKPVADLTRGATMKVTAVNGDWIGGTTAVAGTPTNGWVKQADVSATPAAGAAAQGAAPAQAAAPELKTLRGEWERPAETANGVRTSVSIEITPNDELFARVMRIGDGHISGEMFLFATAVSVKEGQATLTLTEDGATSPTGTVTYAVKDGKLILRGSAKNARDREVDFTGEYTRATRK
jgi:hypothetical protein